MDNVKTYLNKLTPSAKEALDEAIDDVKNRILSRARGIAQSREIADKEISLRDILEAKEQILQVTVRREKKEYRTKRMSQIISLGGAIYALAGILIYTFQSSKFDLKDDLGLLVSGIGILTMLIGFIYSQLQYKNRTQSSSDSLTAIKVESKMNFDIVERWQIIEKLTSDIMREKGIDENRSRSINMIFDFLSSVVGDPSMTAGLKKLLITRNRILHESYHPSKHEKAELIDLSSSIIEQLEKMRK